MQTQFRMPVRFGEAYRVQGDQYLQKAQALREAFRQRNIQAAYLMKGALDLTGESHNTAYVVTGKELAAYRKHPNSQMVQIEGRMSKLRGKSKRNPLVLIQWVSVQAQHLGLYAKHILPGLRNLQERQRENLRNLLEKNPVDVKLAEVDGVYQFQSASRMTKELEQLGPTAS